jgi:hypothetical protein
MADRADESRRVSRVRLNTLQVLSKSPLAKFPGQLPESVRRVCRAFDLRTVCLAVIREVCGATRSSSIDPSCDGIINEQSAQRVVVIECAAEFRRERRGATRAPGNAQSSPNRASDLRMDRVTGWERESFGRGARGMAVRL